MLIPSAGWAWFTHRGEKPSRYAVSLAGPWSQWDPRWDQRTHSFSVPGAAFLPCLPLLSSLKALGIGRLLFLFA